MPNRKHHAKKERLTSNQKQRTFLTWTRVVGYGFRNFTRNAWLSIAATTVMTITLLIIFATAVASSVLNETISDLRAKMDLSFYIKSDASDDTLRNLVGKLRIQPNVAGVNVSTSEDEYKKASKDDVEAWATVVKEGVTPSLPAVIHVKLKDINKRDAIEKFVAKDQQFQEWIDKGVSESHSITTKQNTIDKLSNVMNYASKAGVAAGIIFIVISVLIIFNTIRMTIFSRREEISMMKSIGADSYFIRSPFLIEAELYGLIAAVLALIIGYFATIKILPSLSKYIEAGRTGTELFLSHWWFVILLIMMIIGFVIGDFSARLALRRYLKSTR